MKIIARDVPPRTAWSLEQAGVHPLLARLFAARGVRSAEELDDSASKLLPPQTLRGTQEAAVLLADAIAQGQRICIVADYDCDGAAAGVSVTAWRSPHRVSFTASPASSAVHTSFSTVASTCCQASSHSGMSSASRGARKSFTSCTWAGRAVQAGG